MAETDLFTPIVPLQRLHASYRALMEHPGYAPARSILRNIWTDFVDKDGNFLEQFQTTGFDARIWELFLFALLWDYGADFDATKPRPDFVITYKGVSLNIEAVTANPSQKKPVVIEEARDQSKDPVYRQQQLYPIRLGSALYSKLCKRYWELPHVGERPFILAIEDFGESDSLYHSGASLWQYLYGFRGAWHFDEERALRIQQIRVHEHVHGSKKIPSGFFHLPDARYISAVLFGNSGTIAKFNRLGYLSGYRENILKMARVGLCYDDKPNRAEPKRFQYDVRDPSAPPEDWGQGLSLYHNPNALYPLPLDLLPLPYHFIENGRLRSFLPDFHPLVSQTITVVQKADAQKDAW